MRRSSLLLAIVAAMAVCSSAAAAPSQPADVGQFLTYYRTASTNFGEVILTAAKWLAAALATIDLIMAILPKLLRGEGPQELLSTLVMRVMWYGFLAFLMNVGNMVSLITGFRELGEKASGISVLNPADIFWQGIDMVSLLMQKFSDSANIGGMPVPAGVAAASNPLVAIMIAIVIILIVVAFLILTAQYAVILVQMYFYLACYPIIIAMGSIKYGRDMTTKAISGAIVIGVRFLAVYFVLYAAQQTTAAMEAQLQNFSIIDLTPMWAVFGMSGLLAFIALKAPQMAADLIGGTASLSGGDVVGAAAVAGGAVGAIAGGAAGAAVGTGGTLSGAIKAGGAAIEQARAAGATGIPGIATGAASALANAGAGAAKDAIKEFGGPSSGLSMADRIEAKTASINEVKAAGAPATSVPGGQPAAPQVQSDQPSSGESSVHRATPPAPVAPPTTDFSVAPPSSGSASVGGQAREQSSGKDLAKNLVNELKQADRAHGAAVNIQANSHD